MDTIHNGDSHTLRGGNIVHCRQFKKRTADIEAWMKSASDKAGQATGRPTSSCCPTRTVLQEGWWNLSPLLIKTVMHVEAVLWSSLVKQKKLALPVVTSLIARVLCVSMM